MVIQSLNTANKLSLLKALTDTHPLINELYFD